VSVAASPQPPVAGPVGGTSPPGGASPARSAVADSPAASAVAASGGAPPASVGDACPLCGAPLHPEQEWCLRCGAAARTRLSASPNWKAPIVVVAVVTALSLGVLAAALVKLAGSERSNTSSAATTVATAPAATAPAAPAATPGALTPGATTTGATTPGASTPGVGTPSTASPAGTVPASTAPGASTTPGSIGTSAPKIAPEIGKAKVKATPAPSRAEQERIRKIINPAAK
jgi:hypothetical protein